MMQKNFISQAEKYENNLEKIDFQKCNSVNVNKSRKGGGVELVIHGSQARYQNHWAIMMIFKQIG